MRATFTTSHHPQIVHENVHGAFLVLVLLGPSAPKLLVPTVRVRAHRSHDFHLCSRKNSFQLDFVSGKRDALLVTTRRSPLEITQQRRLSRRLVFRAREDDDEDDDDDDEEEEEEEAHVICAFFFSFLLKAFSERFFLFKM
jgi:hypothetical protein